MVNKILSYLYREVSGLHEAAYLLAFFAFLSQVLALVRDKLLSHTFGATHVLDLYYASFRLPDMVFVSVASLVSLSVLIPFLIEKMEKGEKETKDFVDTIFSLFFLTIIMVAGVLYFAIPDLIPRLFPGFVAHGDIDHLITLSRILLLSPIFLGISNFFAGITQVNNRFFLYAVSPLLYNLGIILGVLFLYPAMGIAGLAWGVVLGAILHCGIQVPFIIKKRLFPALHISRIKSQFWQVKKVVALSFPRTLTLSLVQISTFFLLSLASSMVGGSIAVFSFAYNLQAVPLTIIGVSYSSAAFPLLSRLFTSGDRQKFLGQVIASAQHIIFWSLPIMVLFIVLRAQIVRTILGSGNFTWTDTRLTAACVAIFILAIVLQSLVLLFVRAFYARGETRRPLLLNLASTSLIIFFGYFFTNLYEVSNFFRYFIESIFKVGDLEGTSVLMLALAFSVGTFVNGVLHWFVFHNLYPEFTRPVLKTLLHSLSASVIMGYAAYLALGIFDKVFSLATGIGVFMQGLCAGIVGIIVGIIVLKILNNKELNAVQRTLHQKIWKADVLVPDQDQL